MKEYKLLEFRRTKQTNEEIEKLLGEKSAEGWEVVSLTSDISRDIRGILLVLLGREKETEKE